MPSHEFGIIESIDNYKENCYCPTKYNCISVNDDIILAIVEKIRIIKTYYHNINTPEYGLAYYGVTLIPPSSLKYLQDILLKEKRFKHLKEFNQLIALVTSAIERNKYIIHYGI